MPQIREKQKVYLGDGAYAAFDGHGIELTTENGIRATNTIYLEPDVLMQFERFVAAIRDADAQDRANATMPDKIATDEGVHGG